MEKLPVFDRLSGRSNGGKPPSSNKKILIYAAIGIAAVAAVLAVSLGRPISPITQDANQNSTSVNEATFCGNDASVNSNSYIHEYKLPITCEMPLGIYEDGQKVWYVSTKNGVLGYYDLGTGKFGREYTIPVWSARQSPNASPEMAWQVKSDGKGSIWFVSEKNELWKFNIQSEQFERFKTPQIYPSSFDFDGSGNIYLSGFFGKSLWYADTSKLKNGTSDGFTEIKLPLDEFNGLQTPVGSGSLSVDMKRNVVWLPLLSFEQKGVVFRYDANKNETQSFPLTTSPPSPLLSPSSTSLDDSGTPWVADHATSIFFKLDPANGNVTKYVTSTASPRIYGGKASAEAYTLPYWIQPGNGSIIWFNEHTGNKIARFDTSNETLVEYWIPSQNKYWANCGNQTTNCGLANALQFSFGKDGNVWFSEWTENKLGQLDTKKGVPVSVTLPQQSFQTPRGHAVAINVHLSAPSGFSGNMVSSGTLSTSGSLSNATGTFSENSVSIDPGKQKDISFVFSPSNDMLPGEYTLMVGAENDQVSVLKAVHITVS